MRAHLRRAAAAEPERPRRAAARRRRCASTARARRAWRDGDELALRPKEFDLLALLVAEAGRAVTRERIMREVWDTDWLGSTKTLDTHVLDAAPASSAPTRSRRCAASATASRSP